MTIINVENPLFTETREFKVKVQCLTDDLQPITFGRLLCIFNRNTLMDIKEVKNEFVEFDIKIPDNFEQENEYTLRFSYSGSTQAPEKSKSILLLFNKNYDQRISAEIIVDDYYCKRGETVQFKSHIEAQDNLKLRGKAVLKLDEQSIGHTEITDNCAEFEFTIPDMISNEHTLLWKYGTNEGLFVTTSMLELEPKTPVIQKEYHENKGVSDEIRQILAQPQLKTENTDIQSNNSFTDKIRKLF